MFRMNDLRLAASLRSQRSNLILQTDLYVKRTKKFHPPRNDLKTPPFKQQNEHTITHRN